MVGSAGSSQLSTAIAPSPPSNSARGEDGNELYMDLSWQSSISALCSIGAAKAKSSDFDFLGGSFLDSPGQWSARSHSACAWTLRFLIRIVISRPVPTPQPPPPPQERFTELEPLRQHALTSSSVVPPRIKSATPPSFPPYPEALLDRPPEVPKIPYLFAGSLGPRALPDGSNEELISYFQNVTTKTIVAIDDAASASSPCPRFRCEQRIAERSTQTTRTETPSSRSGAPRARPRPGPMRTLRSCTRSSASLPCTRRTSRAHACSAARLSSTTFPTLGVEIGRAHV